MCDLYGSVWILHTGTKLGTNRRPKGTDGNENGPLSNVIAQRNRKAVLPSHSFSYGCGVVELWSCAAVQKGRIRFWHQEPVLKKEIKLLKSIQNMINDGNKMLEVKIPCILFLEFITQ